MNYALQYTVCIKVFPNFIFTLLSFVHQNANLTKQVVIGASFNNMLGVRIIVTNWIMNIYNRCNARHSQTLR